MARVRLAVEERRRQLLELGRRAFTARPYDEVSIDALAAGAGISRGLIFHYFPTKHAFYLEVLRAAADELVRATVWDAGGASLPERLAHGLGAYFGFVEGHARVFATLLRAGGPAGVHELVEDTRGRFVTALRAELAPYLPRGGEAAAVRAALRGWIGLVEALALDSIDHGDLGRDARVELAARALGALLPPTPPSASAGRARRAGRPRGSSARRS
jgi:AcrR family transcriptional regulator